MGGRNFDVGKLLCKGALVWVSGTCLRHLLWKKKSHPFCPSRIRNPRVPLRPKKSISFSHKEESSLWDDSTLCLSVRPILCPPLDCLSVWHRTWHVRREIIYVSVIITLTLYCRTWLHKNILPEDEMKKTVKKQIRVHKNGSLYMCSQFLTFNEITDPGAQVIIFPVFSIYVSLSISVWLFHALYLCICVCVYKQAKGHLGPLFVVVDLSFLVNYQSDCSSPSCTNPLRFKPRKRLPSLGDVVLWFWTRKRIGQSSHN